MANQNPLDPARVVADRLAKVAAEEFDLHVQTAPIVYLAPKGGGPDVIQFVFAFGEFALNPEKKVQANFDADFDAIVGDLTKEVEKDHIAEKAAEAKQQLESELKDWLEG